MPQTQLDKALTAVAATLSTLAETDGAPETMIYIGVCNMDYGFWETVRTLLVDSGMVNISANYVTLTEQGKATAAKINRLLPKH